jgi:AcrR family transcriptional regulator
MLAAEGADAITTNGIAERAGISIGSLYRYFPNKEAVIAAICERETELDVAMLQSTDDRTVDVPSLREDVAAIVDFQIERHQRLYAIGKDFYRAHQTEFSLSSRMGCDEIAEITRGRLLPHRGSLRVGDFDQAVFLIGRGLSAIVRCAVEERPEQLHTAAFRHELVDLAVLYLVAKRPPRSPAPSPLIAANQLPAD